MERVLFDTNFILTCLKEKIDFLDANKFGKIVVPLEVLEELKKISKDEERKSKERRLAEVALQVIEKNKKNIEFISLGKRFVDRGIIDYAERSMETIIIASLDKNLRRKIKGRNFLSIKPRKKIMLV